MAPPDRREWTCCWPGSGGSCSPAGTDQHQGTEADVWIADGMLHIKAERTQEQRDEKADSFRSEFSYGSFHRAVTLPKGAAADEVKATYKDGVLEVTVPIRPATEAVAKVAINRT